MTVCRLDRSEQFLRAVTSLLRFALGHDGHDLYLCLERYAGDLLLDEERIEDAGACLPDAPPGPPRNRQEGGDAHSQKYGLPHLPGAEPQVASETDQGRDSQDGHGRHVRLVVANLIGVGRVARLGHGALVRLFEVALRPVGAEGVQHQPRHDALVLLQVGQRAEQGDDGVGAGVEEVIVPEGAQRHVVGTARPQVVPHASSPSSSLNGSSSGGTSWMRAWG